MNKKRLWIALTAVPICVTATLVIGAEKSHQTMQSGVIDPTCTSSSPCIEYDNNGTGPGLRGVSLGGNGIGGGTRHNSTSATNATAGVLGNDQSASGAFNAGVRGLSVRGTGVAGQSTTGDAVFGTSTNNNGVFGDSTSAGASGVYGQNDGGGYGVAGRVTKVGLPAILADAGSTGNNALNFNSLNGTFGAVGVTGTAVQTIFASYGTLVPYDRSTLGRAAINAISEFGIALAGSNGGSQPVLTLSTFGTGDLIDAGGVMRLDNAGNMHAHSFTADLAATTGQKVTTYSTQASEPTIEDFGEAQLTNGAAYVRLEPRFASTMDRAVNYLVFITPEGDNRGLYVTQKSAAGFVVRESQGGHSTLAFSYRIIAKPFANESPRLPNYVARKAPVPVRFRR
jgi:hypothetical protein